MTSPSSTDEVKELKRLEELLLLVAGKQDEETIGRVLDRVAADRQAGSASNELGTKLPPAHRNSPHRVRGSHRAIHRTYRGHITRKPILLTTVNLQQVLWSLDETRDGFIEGLTKAYQRMQDADLSMQDADLRKNHEYRREDLKDLRGAIGLVIFMIGALKGAERQNRVLGAPAVADLPSPLEDCNELQYLLRDSAVQKWFKKVYEPDVPDDAAQNSGPANEKSKPLEQEHWQDLDAESLVLYRIGTTSFILRCRLTDRPGSHVLKCLLFPYTKVAPIAAATRDYASTYSPGEDDDLPIPKIISSSDKWILMDFIEGPTLKEFVDECRQTEGKDPPSLRTELLKQIGPKLLEALWYLRCKRPEMQHEDLTPSNIVVSLSHSGKLEKVVFVDIGRNYLYSRKIGLAETREALFVAPEVREGNKESDKSDVYSVGMILSELVDPQGVQGPRVPDSLYEYAPTLARFIEDLVDVDPERRLLIFGPEPECENIPESEHSPESDNIYEWLRKSLQDELNAMPLPREVKPGMYHRLKQGLKQIRDVFYPHDQLKRYKELRDLPREGEATRKYSGWLYRWLVLSTLHWNTIVIICSGGVLQDVGLDRLPGFVDIAQFLTPNCDGCVPIIDDLLDLLTQGFDTREFFANVPARLTVFSALAQTLYYRNIVAGLTTWNLRGKRAKLTEITIRASGVCSLIPILFCNWYQPNWWLFCLIAGFAVPCINNFLCYEMAHSTLESAKEQGLSTAIPPDDATLQAFRQWGWNMAIYIVGLLVVGMGLSLRFEQINWFGWFDRFAARPILGDTWVYVLGTVVISIFVWSITKCTIAAPDVRGRLNRAFIAGERLEAVQVITVPSSVGEQTLGSRSG